MFKVIANDKGEVLQILNNDGKVLLSRTDTGIYKGDKKLKSEIKKINKFIYDIIYEYIKKTNKVEPYYIISFDYKDMAVALAPTLAPALIPVATAAAPVIAAKTMEGIGTVAKTTAGIISNYFEQRKKQSEVTGGADTSKNIIKNVCYILIILVFILIIFNSIGFNQKIKNWVCFGAFALIGVSTLLPFFEKKETPI